MEEVVVRFLTTTFSNTRKDHVETHLVLLNNEASDSFIWSSTFRPRALSTITNSIVSLQLYSCVVSHFFVNVARRPFFYSSRISSSLQIWLSRLYTGPDSGRTLHRRLWAIPSCSFLLHPTHLRMHIALIVIRPVRVRVPWKEPLMVTEEILFGCL